MLLDKRSGQEEEVAGSTITSGAADMSRAYCFVAERRRRESGKDFKKCAECVWLSSNVKRQCRYYNKQVILLLVVSSFITKAAISPIEQVLADTETIKLSDPTIDSGHHRAPRNLDGSRLNLTTTPPATSTTNSKLIVQPQVNQTRASSADVANGSSDKGHRQQRLDMIVGHDSSYTLWSMANQSQRHAYNVGPDTSSNWLSLPVAGAAKAAESTGSNSSTSQPAGDDLSVADSRFVPKSASSRFDEDVEVVEDDGSPSADSSDLSDGGTNYDGASSNLSEQRVVKEITKMLSKGMSQATNQVGLDTLENWKRRSRKRKVVKDTRAKLFEDLLNAAIVSHPDRLNKKKASNKERSGASSGKGEGEGKQSSLAQTIGLSNIDPDMAFDAENVLNHLQGLASLTEGQPSLGFSPGGDDASPVQDESGPGSNEEPHGSAQSDALATEEEPAPSSRPKKSSSSSSQSGGGQQQLDRPIVRQFKKIKKQISQRRKQLDQIKKIFNVDLALNPKDGSLMGKSSNSGSSQSKRHNKERERDNSDEDDETGSSSSSSSGKSKRRNGSNNSNAKMRELMQHLRRNPEILASVMAELTVNADPTSRKSPPSVANDDGPPPSNQFQSLNMSNYDFALGPSRLYDAAAGGADGGADSINRIEPLVHKLKQGNRRSGGHSQLHSINRLQQQLQDLKTNSMPADTSMVPDDGPPMLKSSNSLASSLSSKTKSAEALLLASLRDRQLMNLARLETVLAERQSASDRSQVFSSLLRQPRTARRDDSSSGSSQGTKVSTADDASPSPSTSTTAAPAVQQQQQPQSRLPQQLDNSTKQEKDSAVKGSDVHHFVVTNLNNQQLDPQLVRQASDFVAPHQSYSSQSQDQQPAANPPFTTGKSSPYDQYQQQAIPYTISHHHQEQQQSHSGYPPMSDPTSGQRLLTHHDQQFNNNHYSPHARQQLHSSSLNRFRDWRDVSQSETGLSQRSDKIRPGNITWPSYDPITGGSLIAAMDPDRSSNRPNHLHHLHRHHPYYPQQMQQHQQYATNIYWAQSSNQRNQSIPNEYRSGYQPNQARNGVLSEQDASITRPGVVYAQPQDLPANNLPPPSAGSSNEPENSIYMSSPDSEYANVTEPPSSSKSDSEPVEDSGQADGTDNGDTQPEARIARFPSPVDYFSAYKKDWEDNRTKRKRRNNIPLGSNGDRNENSSHPDREGAIWAK